MAYPYPNILGLGQNTPYDRFINAVVSQVVSTVGTSLPLLTGVGAPEGVVTGAVGQWYVDTSTNTRFLKLTGAGVNGWI